MKKLEDIPKKQVFEAPEGYFETLPGIIQARVAKKETAWVFGSLPPALKYALPVLIVAIGAWWFLNSNTTETPEQMLASIESVDIEAYLDDSDMTTEELLENIDLNQVQVDSLEFENPMMDFNDADVDEILNNIETEL